MLSPRMSRSDAITHAVCAIFAVCLCPAAKSWGAPQLLPFESTPTRMIVGEPEKLTVRIQWDGAPGDYAVLAAGPEATDWASIEVIQMAAETSAGVQTVSQTVRITPSKAGEHTFPALNIAYGTKEQVAPAAPGSGAEARAYPKLTSAPFQVVVREPIAAGTLWLAGGAAVAILGAGLAVVIIRRRRRKPEAAAALSPIERSQDLLHQARRQRLDGNLYEYYLALAKAIEFVAADDQTRALAASLRERARRVGYQGIRPPDDELDGDIREAERALRRFKEATEQ